MNDKGEEIKKGIKKEEKRYASLCYFVKLYTVGKVMAR